MCSKVETSEQRWLERVREHPLHLRTAGNAIKGNRNVVLEAVKKNGAAFRYAAPALFNDKELVLAAALNDPIALLFASNAIRSDRNLVSEIVDKHGSAFQYALLRTDRELALLALRKDGKLLQFLDYAFKDDAEVVLCAVQQFGSAIVFASIRLRNHEEVCLAAIRNHYFAYKYVSATLTEKHEFRLKALSANGMCLELLLEFQDDEEMVRRAVASRGYALRFASDRLKANPSLQFAAISNDGDALMIIPQKHRTRKIVLAAVGSKGTSVQYAPKPMRDMEDIGFAAVATTSVALKYLSFRLQCGGLFAHVCNKLDLYQTFLLCCSRGRPDQGAKRIRVADLPCSKLNTHGPHFAVLLKRHILEYAGVPMGKQLTRMFELRTELDRRL
jgi:hypothetical protein